jgi:lactoylglutathione lyase
MRYLHTMIRVKNLEKSLHFYCEGLNFQVTKRNEYPDGKFTLVFLCPPGTDADSPMLELTYNWGVSEYQRGDAYGHVAFQVESISEIQKQLREKGYDLSWGPGRTPDGRTSMAFVDDPDGYEIELLEG